MARSFRSGPMAASGFRASPRCLPTCPYRIPHRHRHREGQPISLQKITRRAASWYFSYSTADRRHPVAGRCAPCAGRCRITSNRVDRPRRPTPAIGFFCFAAAGMIACDGGRLRLPTLPEAFGRDRMKGLLRLAGAIDGVSRFFGHAAAWLVLLSLPDQRRERDLALSLQPELERLARDPVADVRRHLPARRRQRAAPERACAGRPALRRAAAARQALDRRDRTHPVPDPVDADDDLFLLGVLPEQLRERRAFLERRRAGALAGQACCCRSGSSCC